MDPSIDRRSLLRALPAALAGGVGSQALTGTALGAGSPCKYTVEQGSLSEEVVPLSNGDTIEEFYGYENGSSHTPTGIERSGTSAVFLWNGPEGISLAVINGKASSGFIIIPISSSIEFKFDDLPVREGRWVIADDPGDFNDRESDTTVEWGWVTRNNDGGAFRGGLDSDFEITVDTDSSPLVTDLHFLSGDPADPRRIPLELGREFEIKAGCNIEVDIGIKPSEDTEDPSRINPNRRGGNIPVAVLNDGDVDLDRVDFDSLRFGAPEVVAEGGGARPAHSHSGPLEDTDGDGDPDAIPHWKDVDDDGDLDLVVHFPAKDTGFDGDESKGRLEGETKDGTPLFGTAPVTFVGGNGGGKGGGGGPSAPGKRGNKP